MNFGLRGFPGTSAPNRLLTAADIDDVRTRGRIVANDLTGKTSVDIQIPSTAKRVKVIVSSLSTNGTASVQIRLGTSSGIETSGYLSATSSLSPSGVSTSNYTAGFVLNLADSAAAVRHGSVVLEMADTNIWEVTGGFGQSNVASNCVITGSKTLAGVLSRIRVTTVGGSDTFNSGIVTVTWKAFP